MNRVAERCQRDSSANFHYASKRLYFETKAIKVFLYLAAVVPIFLTFLPKFKENETAGVVLSLISFCVTLMTELSSAFMAEHKESAILELQMYEAEITGSTFSKIEYDRESTNEVHELAIRKGLPKLKRIEESINRGIAKSRPSRKKVYVESVPEEISDEYAYIYLCRVRAAKERFLLSRIFYIYFFVLVAVIITFIFGSFFVKGSEPATYLTLIVGFYPLVMPIIKDCLACKKTMKKCAKMSADIDTFFADGDDSIGRLARFHYYVQNLEFEMLKERPAVFNIIPFMFRKGINVLREGVTYRFLESIKELKSRSLMLKGTLKQPKGKSIITKVELSNEYLDKIAKEKKAVVVNKTKTTKKVVEPIVEIAEEQIIEEPVVEPVKKTTTKKTSTPTVEGEVKTTTKKTTTTKTSQTAKTTKPKTTTVKTTTK